MGLDRKRGSESQGTCYRTVILQNPSASSLLYNFQRQCHKISLVSRWGKFKIWNTNRCQHVDEFSKPGWPHSAQLLFHFLCNQFPAGKNRCFHFKVGIRKSKHVKVFWTLTQKHHMLEFRRNMFYLVSEFLRQGVISVFTCGASRNRSQAECEMETPWLWICRFTATNVTEHSWWSALGHRVLRLLHAQPSTSTQTLCIHYNKWPSWSLNSVCVCSSCWSFFGFHVVTDISRLTFCLLSCSECVNLKMGHLAVLKLSQVPNTSLSIDDLYFLFLWASKW